MKLYDSLYKFLVRNRFFLLNLILLGEGVNQLCPIRSFLPRSTYLALVGRFKWNSLRLLTNVLISNTSCNFRRSLWVLAFVIEKKKKKKKSNFKLSVKTPKQRNSFSEIRQCKKYPGKPKGSILICSSCLLSNDLSLIGGGAENKAGRRGHLEQMMGELEETKPLKTTESLWGDHVSSQSNLHGLWKRFPSLNWR